MTFNKEEYWKRRNNTEEQEFTLPDGKVVKHDVPKPLRGQGDKPLSVVKPNKDSKAEVGFDNHGHTIVKNRAYRRQSVRLPGEVKATKKVISKAERKVLRKKGRK